MKSEYIYLLGMLLHLNSSLNLLESQIYSEIDVEKDFVIDYIAKQKAKVILTCESTSQEDGSEELFQVSEWLRVLGCLW